MYMQYKKFLLKTLCFFLLVSIITSCEKKIIVSDDSMPAKKVETPVKSDGEIKTDDPSNTDEPAKTNKEDPPTYPREINPIDLGAAEEFAVLAYSNITSVPKSLIDGSLGLFPGRRNLILVDPSEVVGGVKNIYASDDESASFKKLATARKDMLLAYKDALSRTPDPDKVALYEGHIEQKILSPGIYQWSSDLIVTDDFTLNGSDKDIWIFKIDQDLKVMANTHLKLTGGAIAKNVYWQVSGSASFEENIFFSGTILAQQYIEMKKNGTLHGRIFAKNGYVNIDKTTIVVPEI